LHYNEIGIALEILVERSLRCRYTSHSLKLRNCSSMTSSFATPFGEEHQQSFARRQIMNNLTVHSYNPHRDGDTHLAGVVACYQESFAGPPWNESHVCPKCSTTFGATAVATLPPKLPCPVGDCTGTLEPFWPTATVAADFKSETATKPTAGQQPSSWIALNGETVVGICWGYTITPDALEQKLELPGFSTALATYYGQLPTAVAYQDELAVLPNFRQRRFASLGNRSIARTLVEARHTDFLSFGATVGAVRTLAQPATRTYTWYTHAGFQVIARYPTNPHRVILARSFPGLIY
jgi:hypothetical protein